MVSQEAIPGEEWRIVSRYPNYEVSSEGRFRNARTERILKTHMNPRSGYKFVSLFQSRRLTKATVRTAPLIAAAFLPPKPSPAHEIDHKNDDRTDERAENLAWLTHSQNVLKSFAAGRHPKHRLVTKFLTAADYVMARKLYSEGVNQCQIARLLKCSNSHVSRIVNHKSSPRWKRRGPVRISRAEITARLAAQHATARELLKQDEYLSTRKLARVMNVSFPTALAYRRAVKAVQQEQSNEVTEMKEENR